MPNLWVIFTTGLLTGGVTCMAVQGGLLAASISKIQDSRFKILGTVSFLVTKLITYTVLGVLLGWMGSKVQLNLTGQAVLQIAVAVYMLGVAGGRFGARPPFSAFLF